MQLHKSMENMTLWCTQEYVESILQVQTFTEPTIGPIVDINLKLSPTERPKRDCDLDYLVNNTKSLSDHLWNQETHQNCKVRWGFFSWFQFVFYAL